MSHKLKVCADELIDFIAKHRRGDPELDDYVHRLANASGPSCDECGGRGYTLSEGPNPCTNPKCPAKGFASYLRKLQAKSDLTLKALRLAKEAGELLRPQCTDGSDVADVLDSFLPSVRNALNNLDPNGKPLPHETDLNSERIKTTLGEVRKALAMLQEEVNDPNRKSAGGGVLLSQTVRHYLVASLAFMTLLFPETKDESSGAH